MMIIITWAITVNENLRYIEAFPKLQFLGKQPWNSRFYKAENLKNIGGAALAASLAQNRARYAQSISFGTGSITNYANAIFSRGKKISNLHRQVGQFQNWSFTAGSKKPAFFAFFKIILQKPEQKIHGRHFSASGCLRNFLMTRIIKALGGNGP